MRMVIVHEQRSDRYGEVRNLGGVVGVPYRCQGCAQAVWKEKDQGVNENSVLFEGRKEAKVNALAFLRLVLNWKALLEGAVDPFEQVERGLVAPHLVGGEIPSAVVGLPDGNATRRR